MKKTIPHNGWVETDKDYFWIHRQNGKDTGSTIAKISSKVFHVRYYFSNYKPPWFNIELVDVVKIMAMESPPSFL